MPTEVQRPTEEYALPQIVKEVADRSVFPHTIPLGPGGEAAYVHGLTKRELFAAMAMQGMLANERVENSQAQVAASSVGMADTLLEELAK